jgi:hypothetical protein
MPDDPEEVQCGAFHLGTLDEADCAALRQATGGLPGSYEMEIYKDPEGDVWATVEPADEAATDLRFSFGRMPGCVVVAIRRADGTRASEILKTLEAAIDLMNAKVFEFYETNMQAAGMPLPRVH